MSNELKFDVSTIAMELIPVAIQAIGVAAFLYITMHDLFQSYVAIILILMWLKVSNNNIADEFGDLRLKRGLYSLLGESLGKEDSAEEFDVVLEQCLMISGSIENDEYRAIATASAIANGVRNTMSFLISIYLVYIAIKSIFNIT